MIKEFIICLAFKSKFFQQTRSICPYKFTILITSDPSSTKSLPHQPHLFQKLSSLRKPLPARMSLVINLSPAKLHSIPFRYLPSLPQCDYSSVRVWVSESSQHFSVVNFSYTNISQRKRKKHKSSRIEEENTFAFLSLPCPN